MLAAKGVEVDVEPFAPPEPVLAVAIHAKSKGDEDKLANALHRLQDEDPVLRIERNPETHQTLLRGMGETHLSIALEKLARKFGVEVETEDVRSRTARRSRARPKPKASSRSRAAATASSRSRGCASSRTSAASGIEFVDTIVGGVIPRQYIPAVEKGVHETAESGGALGFPVVDVKVTCFDGKHHSVDSSEMAFKTAASLGLKEAMAKAGPVLLEPVSELVVTVPEANQGDIMGDLNGKRGRIQGSAAVGGGEVEIVAHRADVGGPALRDRPPLDDRRPGPLHRAPLALRPGARPPRRQDQRRRERSRVKRRACEASRSRISTSTSFSDCLGFLFALVAEPRLHVRERAARRRTSTNAMMTKLMSAVMNAP